MNEEKYMFGRSVIKEIQPVEFCRISLRDQESYRVEVPSGGAALALTDGSCEISQNDIRSQQIGTVLICVRPELPTVFYASGHPFTLYALFFRSSNDELLSLFPDRARYSENTFSALWDVLPKTELPECAAVSGILETAYGLKKHAFVKKNDKNYVARACKYIEENYGEKLSVKGIAETLSVNRQYLTRLFKQKKGISVQDHIIDTRLKKALEILDAGHSVSETAAMVGYGDQFGFTRIFSKKFGMSPTRYKAGKGL